MQKKMCKYGFSNSVYKSYDSMLHDWYDVVHNYKTIVQFQFCKACEKFRPLRIEFVHIFIYNKVKNVLFIYIYQYDSIVYWC